MKRSKEFDLAILYPVYILFGVLLLLMVLIPATVSGQEQVEKSDEPAITPTPYRVYLPLITVGAAPINQLLANPSFEAYPDDVAPWQWLVPEMTHQLYTDSQVAPDGQQYLAVNRQDEANGNKSFYQDVAQPQAGQTYHFAVWVRASEEAVNADKPRTGRIDLWAHGGTAAREHSTRNFQVNDTNWHCVETALKVTQPGHAYLRAEVYLTSLDNFDYYFDHAMLRDDGQATCPSPPPVDGSTLISSGQGFDTCAAPGVTPLATWKQASPYDYFGIYLGGANHYEPCRLYNQQHQTAAWFSDVSQQGWQFIPIWVGPQAPCTSYTVRLSYDLTIAWSEGVTEAQQALAAAANLGLITPTKQGTIIYYDMEYYPLEDACHNAVNAFLAGWVSELQSQGHKAGIYGSVLAVNDWYTLEHVPDSVWVPWYIRGSYDPSVTVDLVNQQWITESYWDNHRLFQYSSGHDESWGSVSLNIDNDTASGLVALEEMSSDTAQPTLHEMQLITANQGWVWVGQQLFWTDTGGDRWANITPPAIAAIKGVFFLDAAYGWVMSTTDHDRKLYLSHTTNGGQTWQTIPLTAFNTADDPLTTGPVYFDFIDPQTGWLVVKLATGLNFSQGLLFKTEDSGATWTQLPIPLGEPVHFVTEEVGWTAGGPTNSELYVTRDGGQTWTAQTIVPQASATGHLAYTLPTFENPQDGAIAVTIGESTQTRFEFFVTGDGGQSWRLADQTLLEQELALGTSLPIHILDSQHWVVADPRVTPTFPDNIVALDLATSTVGWAHSRHHSCTDGCWTQRNLFRTTDGGQTWAKVELPQTP